MSPASAAFKSATSAGSRRKLEPHKAGERAAQISQHIREIVAQAVPDLWAHLTPDGQDMLLGEILDAHAEKRPIQTVLDAWYRTLTLRQDADRETHHRNADSVHSEEPITTSEDLKHRLGL